MTFLVLQTGDTDGSDDDDSDDDIDDTMVVLVELLLF